LNLEASLIPKIGLLVDPSINLEILNTIGIQRAIETNINLEIVNEISIKKAIETLINLETALTSGLKLQVDTSLNLEMYMLYRILLEMLLGNSTITKLITEDSGINNITEDSKITILLDKDSSKF
ncbi:unnamed protein product, partial [marine sediment metagenome]